MSDSDDDIKFRDQATMRFMEALISRKDSDAIINGIIENIDIKNQDDYVDYCFKRIDLFARISYMFADSMRKARLASFE